MCACACVSQDGSLWDTHHPTDVYVCMCVCVCVHVYVCHKTGALGIPIIQLMCTCVCVYVCVCMCHKNGNLWDMGWLRFVGSFKL